MSLLLLPWPFFAILNCYCAQFTFKAWVDEKDEMAFFPQHHVSILLVFFLVFIYFFSVLSGESETIVVGDSVDVLKYETHLVAALIINKLLQFI
jgi:hypothetical protein